MSEDNTITEDVAPEASVAAVVIVRKQEEDGTIRAIPMIQGALDPLAVQTLLEKGIQAWREHIGLPPQ